MRRKRPRLLLMALVVLVLCPLLCWTLMSFVLSGWPLPDPWLLRRVRFSQAAQHAAPLIDAIRTCERDHDTPPASLEELVPHYIGKIPGTGLFRYPSFEYERYSTEVSKCARYDLSGRRPAPLSTRTCAQASPPGPYIVFGLDQRNQLVEATRHDLPDTRDHVPFDAALWEHGEARLQMVDDLPAELTQPGTPFCVIETVLGKPDDDWIIHESPWELRIPCSAGILNWDVFFYWPSKTYPNFIYGGSTERIGAWAYVHE